MQIIETSTGDPALRGYAREYNLQQRTGLIKPKLIQLLDISPCSLILARGEFTGKFLGVIRYMHWCPTDQRSFDVQFPWLISGQKEALFNDKFEGVNSPSEYLTEFIEGRDPKKPIVYVRSMEALEPRQGVGTSLMACLQEKAGVERILLYAINESHPAYAKMGFQYTRLRIGACMPVMFWKKTK